MNGELTKDSKEESTLDMREHNYDQKHKRRKYIILVILIIFIC